MDLTFKIKEKHYKKSRFDDKKEMDSFIHSKKTQIDMERATQLVSEFEEYNIQIFDKGDKIIIPPENQVNSIRTQTQINSITIFLRLIELYGAIDFLSIQTYTFNEKAVFTFEKWLKEEKIKKLQILMTETASFRIPKIYKLVKQVFCENKNANLVFYWLHSKVMLARCGENKFVIDGSGNFSLNAQVEHFNIFHSKKMFDADCKWQNDFLFSKKMRKNHEIYKNF